MSRVSDSMVYDLMTRSVRAAQERAYVAQRRAATGHRVERASDDPVAAARGAVLSAAEARLAGMGRAAGRFENELTIMEQALSYFGELFGRVRQIAIGAAAGVTAAEYDTLAVQVNGLATSMVALANTEVGGVYLFGGFRTGARPFSPAGVYAGDDGERSVEAAPGVSVRSPSGAQLFTAAGGVDVLAQVVGLAADLSARDPAAIAGRLGALAAARDQVAAGRSKIGISVAELRASAEARQGMALQLTSEREQVLDIDPSQAAIELRAAQSALQAAIEQSTRILAVLESSSRA